MIKEKVKQYVAERNAREDGSGSGLGEAATPTTPAIKVPGRENISAPSLNVGQDGVDN